MIEYVDPTTGQSVYKTLTFFMQMLRPGERTLPLKQSASLVVAPFEGKGHSIVDGKRLDWEPFDTIAAPGGSTSPPCSRRPGPTSSTRTTCGSSRRC